MKEIDFNEFNNKVKNNDTFIIDCFTSWCGPCKIMGAILGDITKKDKFLDSKIFKIDVEKNYEMSETYNISAVPNLMAFKDGKLTESSHGFQSIEALKQFINKHI